jgi:hypothetical protein
MRLDETLARAGLLTPIPLLYALGALTYIKLARPGSETETTLLWLGSVPILLVVAGVAVVWFRPRPMQRGALALDRHHELSDRITSALSFRELPAERRTALMDLAIRDAARSAVALEPRRAAPMHVPRELPIVLVLLVGLFALAQLEVRTVRSLPPSRQFEPMVMTGDDVELFRDISSELEEKTQDPEALAAVRRFNQLIEDISERRLDRREVFERLERLDRELAKGAQADREALEEGLKGLARELEKSSLSKPVAEHLREKRLADAEKAMRELAEKLRRKAAPDRAELEKLRNALAKASRANAENAKNIEKRRRDLQEQQKSLLKKAQGDGGAGANQKSLLRKNERQLERLDRERDRAERSRRQLSKLDRELAKAAEDLMRELGASAQDLDQGAEDLNRMAKQEMTEQEKEQLRQRLQELRELVRQQGQGGKQRLQRLTRFGQRARGNRGQDQGQGQGQQGAGQAGRLLKPGKGGDLLILPGGQRTSSAPGQGGSPVPGGQEGQKGGASPGQNGAGEGGGQSWGSGHSPNVQGEPSSLKGATKDVTAVARDTGEGSASSEVIHGAAQRGFVGRGYQKVYTDYRTVAEQVMNQDQIPPGYRFYVQRYFQLIRPRE